MDRSCKTASHELLLRGYYSNNCIILLVAKQLSSFHPRVRSTQRTVPTCQKTLVFQGLPLDARQVHLERPICPSPTRDRHPIFNDKQKVRLVFCLTGTIIRFYPPPRSATFSFLLACLRSHLSETMATSKKVFSLEGKGLKLDTAEDIEPHIAELKAMDDVEEVRILGNTLGVGACKRLGEVLSTKKSLQVSLLLPRRAQAQDIERSTRAVSA